MKNKLIYSAIVFAAVGSLAIAAHLAPDKKVEKPNESDSKMVKIGKTVTGTEARKEIRKRLGKKRKKGKPFSSPEEHQKYIDALDREIKKCGLGGRITSTQHLERKINDLLINSCWYGIRFQR